MKSMGILSIIAVGAIAALAKGEAPESGTTAYRPAVPAAYGYGSWGWPGYYGGQSTVGAALNGLASVISAQGEYNLATSAGAVNWTEAQRNAIYNRQLAAKTYFEMLDAYHARLLARQGPPPTAEQIARLAHYGVPRPLTPNEFDVVSGKIFWPSVLRQDRFASDRGDVDELLERWARYGALSYDEQTRLREAINGLYDDLNGRMQDMPPQIWTESRRFLRSLVYAATKSDLPAYIASTPANTVE
jgi:hypothetical protein